MTVTPLSPASLNGPVGADDVAQAPVIGFGVSAPTLNASYHPATGDELPSEPSYNPQTSGNESYQTAWWRFVAPRDTWVKFDLHKSMSNYDYWGDGTYQPATRLTVYLGVPGNLWPITYTEESVKLGDDTPSMADGGAIQWKQVHTSEVIVKVNAGHTYWVQAGMVDQYTAYVNAGAQASTTYILTVTEVVCRAHEVVVPAVGPFLPALGDNGVPLANDPIVVGGDDALRRDTNGYIELPPGGAKFSGLTQPLAGVPGWPPPSNARLPGNYLLGVVQVSQRYYSEVIDETVNGNWSGELSLEGWVDGAYRYDFATVAYPALDGPMVWNPDMQQTDGSKNPPPPSTMGGWQRDGGWQATSGPNGTIWTRGPNVKSEGVVQGLWITDTDVYLRDGEYRTIYDPADDDVTAAAKWYRWYGDWSSAPFYSPQYQAALFQLDPPDYHIWNTSGTGYRLSDGIAFAASAQNLRIHWMEWVIRWITFEDATGVLTGAPVGDRREFSDA